MSDNVVLNYMSDLEIVDFIQNYIDKSSYNYAVLIDGSWGSGKTFLLENTIIPSIKKNQELNKRKGKKVIYISLYGITTKDELTRQIWIETVAFSKVLKSKSFKIASSIGKVALGGALSSQGVSLPGFYIDKDMFMSLEKCILIFDDLERCSMDVNVILGYINNFVEHDGIKVIIVANEKEIATTRLSSNKEFKYLVALNHDIDFTESKENNQLLTSDFTNKQKTDLNTKINLNELSTKVKLLFGQDDSYKQIKEKLIGVTIHYKPNIDVIIDKIVQNNIDSEAIRSIIIRNKYFIIEKLDFYMHQNIRTIMFCIDKFNILSKCIIDEFSFKDSEKVLNDIFRYIVTISIKYKTGKSLPKWEDNSEIEQVSVSGESLSFYDGIKGFKFVDDFISETKFNKVRVLDVIRRHLVILKNDVKDPNDPLFMLSNNWFSMEEDSDVVNLLACVNIALTEEPNKYNISSYSNIIYLNITLNRVGVVSTDISKILQRMKDNIKLFHVGWIPI